MVVENEQNSEEPPTNKNTWWRKHKEDILIWTSIGSFILSLLQFIVFMVKCFK